MPVKWAKICLKPSRNPMVAGVTLNLFKVFPIGCFRPLGLLPPGGCGIPEGNPKVKLKYLSGKPRG